MRNGRCRLHGGKSTGPRTPEGRERSRRSNWKHGHYSAEARAERAKARASLRETELIADGKRHGIAMTEYLLERIRDKSRPPSFLMWSAQRSEACNRDAGRRHIPRGRGRLGPRQSATCLQTRMMAALHSA